MNKDNKLIWESMHEKLPPDHELGILKHDMTEINVPSKVSKSVPLKKGSGERLILTPEEAKSLMFRMKCDNKDCDGLFVKTIIPKGTMVTVNRWGNSNERFNIGTPQGWVVITDTELAKLNWMSRTTDVSNVSDYHKRLYVLIDKWVDFSKTPTTIGRLKGLR